MKKGGLNIVRCSNVVTKICVVQESSRPSKLLVEKWATEQMFRQGVNVPKIISYNRDDLEREVLVMERIHGETIPVRMTESGVVAFSSLGVQLRKRACKYDGFGWIDPISSRGVYSSWREFLVEFTERYGRQILKYGAMELTELALVLKCLESNPDLVIKKSAIIHRDIKPGNVIWDGRNAYLIDWENAILGDPMFDLALYLMRFGADRRWHALVSGIVDSNFRLMVIYQIVALIGAIDFSLTFRFGVKYKIRKLNALLHKLQQCTIIPTNNTNGKV